MNGTSEEDDSSRFVRLAWAATVLILFVLTTNIMQDSVLGRGGEYIKRRIYYEKVLSRKGLSLHKGSYWKEKE